MKTIYFSKRFFAFVFALIFYGIFSHVKSQIVTEVFQPDATTGQDALVSYLIDCSSPIDEHNVNYGNHEYIIAREWTFNTIPENCNSGTSRSFIRFVEMNSIPSNATILSAKLFLYGDFASPSNMAPNAIQIGSVLNMWDEQTITWTNKPAVDYSFGITHNSSSEPYQDIQIDVTSIVSEQFQNGTNYGFGIKLINEVIYSRWTWASSNNNNSTKRPKLEITYSLEEQDCNPDFSYFFNTETNKFVFTPSSTNANLYDWSFEISNYLLTEPLPITLAFPSSGYYSVCLHINNSCRKCIQLYVNDDQVNQGTLINEAPNPENTQVMNLYPNPSLNNFFLEIFTTNPGIGKLVIYDLKGSKISEKSFDFKKGHQTLEHSISKFSKGMYVCTIEIDGIITRKRFIKE